MELVLNPAKQFIVLKDKRGVVHKFVMKPLFSGEVFYFFKTNFSNRSSRLLIRIKKGEL